MFRMFKKSPPSQVLTHEVVLARIQHFMHQDPKFVLTQPDCEMLLSPVALKIFGEDTQYLNLLSASFAKYITLGCQFLIDRTAIKDLLIQNNVLTQSIIDALRLRALFDEMTALIIQFINASQSSTETIQRYHDIRPKITTENDKLINKVTKQHLLNLCLANPCLRHDTLLNDFIKEKRPSYFNVFTRQLSSTSIKILRDLNEGKVDKAKVKIAKIDKKIESVQLKMQG